MACVVLRSRAERGTRGDESRLRDERREGRLWEGGEGWSQGCSIAEGGAVHWSHWRGREEQEMGDTRLCTREARYMPKRGRRQPVAETRWRGTCSWRREARKVGVQWWAEEVRAT